MPKSECSSPDQFLKAVMKLEGLNVNELAYRLNVPRQTMSKILNERQPATYEDGFVHGRMYEARKKQPA